MKAKRNAVRNLNRMTTDPLDFKRTNRAEAVTVLTSGPAGRMIPFKAFPVLREDSIKSGNIMLSVEMAETAELIINPVFLDAQVWLVPFSAFERFEHSIDQLNRSWAGVPQIEGGDVVPFFETHAYGTHGSNAVYKALGIHGKPTDQVNTMYLEAYNLVWNHRAKQRSPDITERLRLADTLAPAFWKTDAFGIVPDFDQEAIDGEVSLNVLDGRMPVRGIGKLNNNWDTGSLVVKEPELVESSNPSPPTTTWSKYKVIGDSLGADHQFAIEGSSMNNAPNIYAELRDAGVTISLSNIEAAKKTQAYARLRKMYSGHDEDWVIDNFFMRGLRIPDQHLMEPVMLASGTTTFGQSKRYASDGANLTESAVNGVAQLNLSFRMPPLHTGGVVICVCEAVPELLFERRQDAFFHAVSVEQLPDALRDDTDPEPIEIVLNKEIDTDHGTPDGTFGYRTLNAKWQRTMPNAGGKFFRPTVNTVEDEDRQRLWAHEQTNPALSEDFYLANGIHQKPFLDTEADPFEIAAKGMVVLNGLTQFGPALAEASDDYQRVSEMVPMDRIVKAE